ncbi:MAG: M43 family zinc metalloprotease, partial [Thermoprotei archaeon]
MKARFLTVIFIIFLISPLYSQATKDCLTEVPPGVTIQQSKSGNLQLYKRTEKILLRLAIHIVTNSQGQYGISINELNYKLSRLNYYFSQVLFEFYVFSIDTIKSDAFYRIDNFEEANLLRQINNYVGCINVYFVDQLMDANGLSSFSPRIDNGPQGIIVINTAPETTLPHEVGHYFDLFHTYQAWQEQPGGPYVYENIARSGSCSNCQDAGDLLCDTPADPSGRVEFSTIDTLCNWSPQKPLPADGCGQTNYNPLTNNMMITQMKHCRTTFTEGQKNRMNETLMLYRRELTYHIVYLMNVINGMNARGTLSVDDKTYPSGTRVPLPTGIYRIRTNNERFPNFMNSGITYKHNNWNEVRSDYFLSRLVPIDTSQNQFARFEEILYSKIDVLLEGSLIPNKGQVLFQDPWYVLSDGSQPGNYW